MRKFIAHAKCNEKGEWLEPHLLEDHLQSVARLAKEMAKSFGQEWAELAGLWHDLGKYRKRFQKYIREQSGFEVEEAHVEDAKSPRAPHSTAGAIHAQKQLGPYGIVLAYLIAGHHAGLPDWDSIETGKAGLKCRLVDGMEEYTEAVATENAIPQSILRTDLKQLPPPPISFDPERSEAFSLWVRMLFSCLVDADFLDTEAYMNPESSKERKKYSSLPELQKCFMKQMDMLKAKADPTKLNEIRSKILDQCINMASLTPGNFSLTVPTGGGKTLASMAFALEHAIKHGKQRIIYAIPFTSIIEQNASVFRSFLGEDTIIEHHSNLDPKEETARNRLATENWEAPVIVTTNVQLFESLFAARTSRCRKLHNLVNSVIVLDEAQQIPRDFQKPITLIMQHLADYYGVTWVLCTATQPDLRRCKDSFGRLLLEGLKNVREIIPDPETLAEQLKRVEVIMPKPDTPRLSWDQVAEQLRREDNVLAIVNTRKHARELLKLMPDDDNTLHLSAQMAPKHRTHVLDEIKMRLRLKRDGKDNRPLRVISTQLVEAGVDIDFPVVYRALAGLDSIAQSAGRCNREGKMETLGRVVVFIPEENAPSGLLRQGQQVTEELLSIGALSNPLSPVNFIQYFQRLNNKGDRDKYQILSLIKPPLSGDAPLAMSLRTAAQKFQMINEASVSIIVPYIEDGIEESRAISLLMQLQKDQSVRRIYRELQQYSVNLPERQVKQMLLEGALEVVAGQYLLLASRYHPKLGVLPPEALLSAEESVI
jgi:CRISPR-associated endonuclease/helicase Cas3